MFYVSNYQQVNFEKKTSQITLCVEKQQEKEKKARKKLAFLLLHQISFKFHEKLFSVDKKTAKLEEWVSESSTNILAIYQRKA